MYFPVFAAKQLSTVPTLPNLTPEEVLSISSGPKKLLFCSLTRTSLSVWRVRPPVVLAHLARTQESLLEHGENVRAEWVPDGSKIVIQTAGSYLVLVTVEHKSYLPVYQQPALSAASQRSFQPGPGEAHPIPSVSLYFEGVIFVEGHLLSVSPRRDYLLFSTRNPRAVQRIPWPDADGEEIPGFQGNYDSWSIDEYNFPWLDCTDVAVTRIMQPKANIETWITSEGNAYFVQLQDDDQLDRGPSFSGDDLVGDDLEETNFRLRRKRRIAPNPNARSSPTWIGTCFHTSPIPRSIQKRKQLDLEDTYEIFNYEEPRKAVEVAVNLKFSLIAVGTEGGSVEISSFPAEGYTSQPQVLSVPNMYTHAPTGPVRTIDWSSDGYVLAVGWEHGWAVWSVAGRCLAWGFGTECAVDDDRFQDAFMYGIRDLFWAPGNFELFVLAERVINRPDGQLFTIPFAKSAATGQQSPDNTRHAFLHQDDRVLVYRGAEQPDMSVINPESDVWQHIKIPETYMGRNWPLRYSALSSDGRLIAVAGRRGLVHYSSTSGRWKLFSDERQEQAFVVRGGMVWFHHVLIAAVEVSKSYQIRLYSRDAELANKNVLHREILTSPIIVLSLVDNSLLVYTADNNLHHHLVIPTPDTIKTHFCGTINFNGIIASPNSVRTLSWMLPSAQKQLGDPVDDLAAATVLMVVGGKLALLRPRKSRDQEVRYDLQILADRIEFCWIHLQGIGSLENSLWGYDGQGLRVWLNALSIEAPSEDSNPNRLSEYVKESLNIPLDFYPLSVLMDKGIIIGAEHEAATRMNLPFVMFRQSTSSHLFLHHILLHYLEAGRTEEAVIFASHYKELTFFAHALEILLHTIVEAEADLESIQANPASGVLPAVVEFLDHFDASLDVVVGCARKTEMTRWRRLFDIVGNPKALFETCLQSGRLKTAGSYLLVLHNLEQLDESHSHAARLLSSAVATCDWQLCRELMRFLHSIDDTGTALKRVLSQTNLMPVLDEVNGTNEVLQ